MISQAEWGPLPDRLGHFDIENRSVRLTGTSAGAYAKPTDWSVELLRCDPEVAVSPNEFLR
jgi:hypothetical protein